MALAVAALAVAVVSWGGDLALLGGIAAAAAAAMLVLLLKADCLYVPELLLVALLSANYNVFFNSAAFIEGGADLGRLLTPLAVGGLALFMAGEVVIYARRRIAFVAHPADYAAAAVAAAATLALGVGALRGNDPVWLLGDYGQLLYVVLAYAVVRLRYGRLGGEALRTFLILLAVSWGARAMAELLFPEYRGTPMIDLGNGVLEPRRTDPLAPVAIPLLLGLVLSERRPERLALLVLALVAVLLQTLLGFTRTYYVTLVLSLALVALLGLRRPETRGRTGGLVVAGGGALLVVIVVLAPVRDLASSGFGYFTTLFEDDTPSRVHRTEETRIVLDLIGVSPVIGYGLGYEYVGVEPGTLRSVPVHFIHNSFLALWFRGGITLVVSWCVLLALSLLRIVHSDRRRSIVAMSTGVGILAVSVSGLAAESMFSYVLGPVLGVALALTSIDGVSRRD